MVILKMRWFTLAHKTSLIPLLKVGRTMMLSKRLNVPSPPPTAPSRATTLCSPSGFDCWPASHRPFVRSAGHSRHILEKKKPVMGNISTGMPILSSCALIIAVTLCPLAAQAGMIVFGNLGATGTTALSTTNTDLGTSKVNDTNWIAQGFNTGTSSLLTVDAITVGLFGQDPGTTPLTVSIYSSSAGAPDAVLFTSASTNVGSGGKYSFNFSGATLAPNTTYFVVPNGGSWYWNTGTPAGPVGQNASGYTSADTYESTALGSTPAGPWITPASSTRYSVSVQAVPEPSTLVLGAVGFAGAYWLRRRRLKSKSV